MTLDQWPAALGRTWLGTVLGILLWSWPRDARISYGHDVVDVAVATVGNTRRARRWVRALHEAAALIVAGSRLRLRWSCGGTVAGGWILSVRWAVAVLLCWASVDLGLLLARNASWWWGMPNAAAVVLCIVAGVAVRAMVRGVIALPLQFAVFLVAAGVLRAGSAVVHLRSLLFAIGVQGVATLLLVALEVVTRRWRASGPPDRVAAWWWTVPAGLLVLGVQVGRDVSLAASPGAVAVALVVVVGIGLVDPRVALTAVALVVVSAMRLLFAGVEWSPGGLAVVGMLVVVMPVSAHHGINLACRS